MSLAFKPTRRQLLAAGLGAATIGGAGLVLAVRRLRGPARMAVPPRDEPLAPSVYLSIGADDKVRIWLLKAELGQGVMTSLPMIVADELGADWDRVEVVQAVAHPNYWAMLTAVSESVRGSIDDLRHAGAAARTMLVTAAAAEWGVDRAECSTKRGRVVGPEGRSAPFGAFAEAAGRLAVPARPELKPRSALELIGTSVPRIDIPDKTTGKATFAIDVRRPDLRFAVLARPPGLGATVERFDADAARRVAGVEAVHALPSGVAVIARSTYAAMKGARALNAAFSPSSLGALSSEAIDVRLLEALDEEGKSVLRRGAPSASPSVEALYRTPLLAHATLEPQSSTAHVQADRAEIWAPTQNARELQARAAEWLELPTDRVIVHTTLVGGAFGRRVHQDVAEEAVRLSKAVGHPVQVVFTREDDTRHDFYRPPALHALRGALDATGMPLSWEHRIVSPSILGQADPGYAEVDAVAVEGSEIPYAIPNVHVRYVNRHFGVPLGFWRSVGHSHNAFAVECFLDELAREKGQDPVELRRRLLKEQPRHLGVLELCAKKAGWKKPVEAGRARGVAVHASYGSWVAQIAEVSLSKGNRVRVHRVVAAVDAGWIIHPDTVKAQIEGGIIFGLTAALYGEITLEDGSVQQSNFHDYPLLRFDETPDIEVHLVESSEPPGGVGEIGVPPIAPAVANAVATLTGEPVRALPIRVGDPA